MDNYFIIGARLPSLNEYTLACRGNKYGGAKFKRAQEDICTLFIRKARRERILRPVECPVDIYIQWHERTKKRDADNIISSTKFVLDSMVKNGIIPNDSRRYVKQVYSKIYDDKSDFVVVEIKEATP